MQGTKYKVFLDISWGFKGYSGIPQDTRLIYKILASNEKVDLSTLIMDVKGKLSAIPTFKKRYKFLADKLSVESLFFAEEGPYDSIDENPRIIKFLKKLRNLKELKKLISQSFLKRKGKLQKIEVEYLWKYIWLFNLRFSLLPQDKNLIFNATHYLTDISLRFLQFRTLFSLPPFYIPLPEKIDFLILPYPLSIKTNPYTKKLIRYHDAIPFTDTPLISSKELHIKLHKRGIETNLEDKNTFFICNSEPAKLDLLNLYPELEKRTFVVPCAVSEVYYKEKNPNILKEIFATRLSSLSKKYFKNIEKNLNSIDKLKYILNVSTLEPRKNHSSLIKAFRILKGKYPFEKFILVFVGKLGWKYDFLLKEMKDLMKQGLIIHLEDLLPEELRIVYSHAEVFCFPSFNEGFGYGPVEATQCGTISVISDIPTHKWVMKNGALYCDPYDHYSIARELEKVLFKMTPLQKKNFLQEAQKAVDRFRFSSISNKWIEVFEELKTKN